MKAGRNNEQPSSVNNPRKLTLLWLAAGVSILFWFIWKTVSGPPPRATPKLDATGRLLNEPGSAAWNPVPGFRLGNVAALSLSTQTDRGAAISSRGVLLETTDAGQTWSPAPGPPIGQGEELGSIASTSAGDFTAASHIDESDYTGIYARSASRSWRATIGAPGGVLSGDDKYLVGGFGLVGVLGDETVRFFRIPNAEQSPIYTVAHYGDVVLAAGADGLIARSPDAGATWSLQRLITQSTDAPQQIDALALSTTTGLAGGLNGGLWRSDSQGVTWAPVKGFASTLMITCASLGPDGKEAIIAGGTPAGLSPFVAASSDAGLTWRLEPVAAAKARVTAIARSRTGIYAATADGYLLVRR